MKRKGKVPNIASLIETNGKKTQIKATKKENTYLIEKILGKKREMEKLNSLILRGYYVKINVHQL